MKKAFTFVGIAVLTFVIGATLTKVYFKWNVRFQPVGGGAMAMCKEGFGGISAFESNDGERVTLVDIRFPSEAAAEECFQITIQKGMNILGREDLWDKTQTNIVGERIVGGTSLDGHASGIILSRRGDFIVEIASSSLRHAMIFEQMIKKH